MLRPWLDFVPLKKDFSNFEQALGTLADKKKREQIINSAKSRVLNLKNIQIESLIKNIVNDIYGVTTPSSFQPPDIKSFIINCCNHQPHLDPRLSWHSQANRDVINFLNFGFNVGEGPWEFYSINCFWENELGRQIANYKIELGTFVSSAVGRV